MRSGPQKLEGRRAIIEGRGCAAKELAKLDIRAQVEEAYTALKAMVEEEERSRSPTKADEPELISLLEETDWAHAEAEELYHGTTRKGVGQDALSTCEERQVEDKTETPDIGEASPAGACAIKRKATTNGEELMCGRRGPPTPNPETVAVGPESPRESRAEEGTGRAPLSANSDKDEKQKDVSTRLPTLAPEIMAVGPERPRESLEEEGDGMRRTIAQMSIRGRNRQEPSEPIPENSTVGPVRPRETEEMEDGSEESWHDASEEGRETACGKATDEDTTERWKEEKDRVEIQSNRGTIGSVFRGMDRPIGP